MDIKTNGLKEQLDKYVDRYLNESFVEDDPIQIPKQFSLEQDIEIIGLITACLAWGNRKTIIKKCKEIVELMDGQPYDFIINHTVKERFKFQNFKHRTFNFDDCISFFAFLQEHFRTHSTLEVLFSQNNCNDNIETGLVNFYTTFTNHHQFLPRSAKHLSCPSKKSACKRLNLFLRWMVRPTTENIDFGIWKTIKPSQLMIPLDVHVLKSATKLGLIKGNQNNWNTVKDLTSKLKEFDPIDPIRYDFALFLMSIQNDL